MDNIINNYNWVIWFYLLVILPFQIYDFYMEHNKNIWNYIKIAIFTILPLITGLNLLIRKINIITPGIGLYILIGLCYLQSLYDCFYNKTCRNYWYFGIFTLFIILISTFKH